MTAIRVLVVDDSISVRKAVCSVITSNPWLEVFGQAGDPFEAVKKMQSALPDVILLDLELPRMDGLTFLRRIMAQRPIPVVVLSSYTQTGSVNAIKAFEYGACEVLLKPDFSDEEAMATARDALTDAICTAVEVGRSKRFAKPSTKRCIRSSRPRDAGPKLTADVILPLRPPRGAKPAGMQSIVAIGASTGGTDALGKVLAKLDKSCAPVVVVQHMPEYFTSAFARRLDTTCAVEVREAEDGDRPESGKVLIAPGNKHMVVAQQGSGYRISIVDGPQVSRHRPAVDVLFRSVAMAAGAHGCGILMTGMGDDGARGLLEMRDAGAETIIQDEKTSVVWGMPGEAWKLGATRRAVPLSKIPAEITRFSSKVGAS